MVDPRAETGPTRPVGRNIPSANPISGLALIVKQPHNRVSEAKTTIDVDSQWGSFALVAYLPEPLGAFLKELRDYLPGDASPQAHITILPPRPLKGTVAAASREARRVLSEFRPFWVELSQVHVFTKTGVLYLDIADGNQILHELHDVLNTGVLAHEENFEFAPHLTISGPIPKELLEGICDEAKARWKQHQHDKRFQINEVVALWQPQNGVWADWDRVWAQKLGSPNATAQST